MTRGGSDRLPRLPRPRKPGLPVTGAAAAVIMWGVVAHDSGVGWVQATGALVAGFLAVGLLAPALAVRRARCTVVSCPTDAVAGQPVTIEVATSCALELRPAGARTAAVSGPSQRCRFELVPEHRGVAERIVVSAASAAPFGLLWWERPMVLDLPRALVVAPRTGRAGRADATAADPEGLALTATAGHGGEPRGVRPYEHGDRRHLVHWPASAHTGALMVREADRPAQRPLSVSALLPDDPVVAERVAERALGTVVALLGAGQHVELVTREAGAEVRAQVTSAAAAGRRLGLATPTTSPAGAASR